MPITSLHQQYKEQQDRWRSCRDVIAGEFRVKDPDYITLYLPVPPAMQSDLGELTSRYTFYSTFAELPEITLPMSEGIQGLIHDKAPEYNLPSKMAYLEKSATLDGDSLLELWQLVTREVFYTGRISLLAEIRGGRSVQGDQVCLCPYAAESLINWRLQKQIEGGAATLVVLDELQWVSKDEDPYEQEEQHQWRELSLDEAGRYRVRVWEEAIDTTEGKSKTIQQVVMQEGADADGWVYPLRVGQAFNRIPLTVVNATDRGFQYGPVPVWPLAKRALSIFRLNADYRRALYTKADPTPYVFGVHADDVPRKIGGDTVWAFENPDGKAGYLDIDGDGIPLQRAEIELEYERFWAEAGHMLETSAKGVEAAEALRIRQNMKQVSVKTLVKNAADGMQEALRSVGRMLGLSDSEVESITFTPNLEFSETALNGRELLEMMQAKNQGAPISLKTIHGHMNRRRMTDMEYEAELSEIDGEGPDLGLAGRDTLQQDTSHLMVPDTDNTPAQGA